MFKKILIVIAVIVLGAVGVVAMQPNDFHVERSATMAAPASDVFAQVNDFHKWAEWSPFDKMDPAMKRTFEGPTSGQDAKYSWVGDPKNVGEGSMTILESKPNDLIHIKLAFTKPMVAQHDVYFHFKNEADGTKVTWSMDGEKCLVAKALCLINSMDQMVGGDFAKGLASMKAIVEGTATK